MLNGPIIVVLTHRFVCDELFHLCCMYRHHQVTAGHFQRVALEYWSVYVLLTL